MLSDATLVKFDQQLLVMRIIHIALFAGVAGFSVFAIVAPAGNIEATLPHLDWAIAALGVATAIGGWVLPYLIMAGSSGGTPAVAANGDTETQDALGALGRLQSAMIVGWAMFEGGAIGNLLWYYSERQALNLAVAGVLLVFLLFRFPRRGAILEQVESRLRQLREEKQMTGTAR